MEAWFRRSLMRWPTDTFAGGTEWKPTVDWMWLLKAGANGDSQSASGFCRTVGRISENLERSFRQSDRPVAMDFVVGKFQQQVPPLRYAPVGMTTLLWQEL